ncbi:hypothetical protein KIN20_038171 [Parelaphostrongylus tenuis]|uniref:Uncharacterized protein n=1 Tax=Parelaphostrongylus tenuis TaxID=148309 RepID=A0AAD5WLK5_PARTN|nr:hypothetical protein KIN20_038171 [Parelaphostrongylus tenuis]
MEEKSLNASDDASTVDGDSKPLDCQEPPNAGSAEKPSSPTLILLRSPKVLMAFVLAPNQSNMTKKVSLQLRVMLSLVPQQSLQGYIGIE